MRLPRPPLLAVAACLAFPAAAAAEPTASFEISPAEPRPDETVTFTSTTTATGTAPVRLDWDLDADGQFDDATGASAARAYAAGDHVVRLRARQVEGTLKESTTERTVHVAPPPPPPPPPPGANAAPTAVIDSFCFRLRVGDELLCDAPLTKVGKEKTFKATKSVDPDGQIVRYEWDLDGDGAFETDTGATPQVSRTYEGMGSVTIGLRVTDDDGATATTTLALEKLESDCVSTVIHERVRATSFCFRRTRSSDTRTWTSRYPVDVNGISVAPGESRTVRVNLQKVPLPIATVGRRRYVERLTVQSSSAEATMPIEATGGSFVLDSGSIKWKLARDELTGVELPSGGTVNGLRIATLGAGIALPALGVAEPALFPQLPAAFGAPTADKPIRVTVRTNAPLFGDLIPGKLPVTASAAQDAAPMRFEVPSAALGPLGLTRLVVTYDGHDLWDIAASASIPDPLNADIDAHAGIRAGGLSYASADIGFPKGLKIYDPVYLTRIAFQLQLDPSKASCIGAEYGAPDFALCGEIGLSAGPPVYGERALGIDGGLGFATFKDRPSVVRAFGKAVVAKITIASAEVEVHTNGYINASGSYQWGYPDWVNWSGALGLEMQGSRFNGTGGVQACFQFVDVCQGARALISNKGIAACMDVDLWVSDWHPGAGYEWGGPFTPYFSGCDLGDYRVQVGQAQASAARSRPQTFQVAADLPGIVVVLDGRGGAPAVTLEGPGGASIDAGKPGVTAAAMVIPDARHGRTHVAIPAPAAGTWRIVEQAGSAAVARVRTANGLHKPQVEARVTGRGHRRVLAYEVEPRQGQVVTFSERGASAGAILATVKGPRGRARFAPADGTVEERAIVATVTQDGIPRDQFEVARYTAPRPARAGRVRGLTVRRRGTTAVVRWRSVPGAVQHLVVAELPGGRRVVRQTRRRAERIPRAGRGARVKVTVRGRTQAGLLGPAAKRVLR